LVSHQGAAPYVEQIRHIRSQQLRLKRDAEFRVPTFEQVKQVLRNALPSGIDDLRAMILDRLEIVQNYVRNGDTAAWEQFWDRERPKDENTCRDRLIDLLRPRLPSEVAFLPETLMPDQTRADIVAIFNGTGVPIEIKGQWHKDVWRAASVQLIEKYARDWRAEGRGVYLVLWFGDVRGKNIPRHPLGWPSPITASDFSDSLVQQLTAAERRWVDVVVFDVSSTRPRVN
jgi:hypothetical protein